LLSASLVSCFGNQLNSDLHESNGVTDELRMAEARKRFTVLTWNVWFEHLEYANRVRAIFEVTRQLNPDVICFQEV